MTPNISILEELHRKYLPLREGKTADYIPELSKADPDHFGIALVSPDGKVFEVGDSEKTLTLQSMSKPFVYGLALETLGHDAVHARVGVEPTGEAFNSIIELEERSHLPFNPMINSGAIAVSSMIPGQTPAARLDRILDLFSRLAGRTLETDRAVFLSERDTGHRNRAIAHLLRHFGVIGPEIEESLDLYFQQCAISVSTRDLAFMAGTLANGGVRPGSHERIFDESHVRDMLSLMFTCGMYDAAGKWAFTVGLPAKSGVSGGILAVVPGKMGIAVSSPLLDSCGHSIRGTRFFQELSARLNLSVFHAPSQ